MVNIKEFKLDKQALEEAYGTINFTKDRMEAIFMRQLELMEEYHNIERINGCVVIEPVDFGDVDRRDVQMRIKDLMQRTIEELMEAANTLKNKPWKQDMILTDRDHFYEEIADAFHFFVEMCITAGIHSSTLFDLYFRKSEVNKFRQRSGY